MTGDSVHISADENEVIACLSIEGWQRKNYEVGHRKCVREWRNVLLSLPEAILLLSEAEGEHEKIVGNQATRA